MKIPILRVFPIKNPISHDAFYISSHFKDAPHDNSPWEFPFLRRFSMGIPVCTDGDDVPCDDLVAGNRAPLPVPVDLEFQKNPKFWNGIHGKSTGKNPQNILRSPQNSHFWANTSRKTTGTVTKKLKNLNFGTKNLQKNHRKQKNNWAKRP